MFDDLIYARKAKACRTSSWDKEGRNEDKWIIKPGESKILADIKGPGKITHIWMTQRQIDNPDLYRDVLIKIYWDNEQSPSILAPLGDFFCLGHSIVTTFQSFPFSSSAKPERENKFGEGTALNCYLQMPFNNSARIELVNEGNKEYLQYFYIDYETYEKPFGEEVLYLHAQFNRENPTDGLTKEFLKTEYFSDTLDERLKNKPHLNIVNLTGDQNYVILQASGEGHYIGCNLSVTNLHKSHYKWPWWGEGDDMIFIDGEPWPPRLHGTGSEDYFNQAWGMQDNAFLFNGSSIYEKNTGGYQTSYVFHILNPIRFKKEIKVTIEHGHGNHMSNEYSSVAYWYQKEPHRKFGILPVEKRKPLITCFKSR